MIDLDPKDLEIVTTILATHVPDCEVRVFGSRVQGTAKKFSDLDLLLLADAPIDWRRLENLKDAFSLSDLPIRVDVLDERAISPSFKKAIEAPQEILQQRTASGIKPQPA